MIGPHTTDWPWKWCNTVIRLDCVFIPYALVHWIALVVFIIFAIDFRFFRCAKRIESVSLFVIDWVAFLVSVLCRLNLIYGKPSASAGERRYPSSNSIQAVWTDRSIAGRLAIDRNDITAYQYPLKIISKQSVSKRPQQPSGCISSNVTIMQSMVHSLGCF